MNNNVQFKIEQCGRIYLSVIVIFLFSILSTPAVIAANNSVNMVVAQSVTQSKITLSITDKPLRTILNEIQKQTSLGIAFEDNGEIDAIKSRSINVKNVTVEQVLTTLLKGTGFSYRISRNVITVFKEKPAGQTKKNMEVRGSVADMSDNPLAGVSVTIKGTTIGVATDSEGRFQIKVPETGNVIMFSLIGMTSQEIVYSGQNQLDVVLNESVAKVDEVVVTGYQTVRRERMTGSTKTITADQIVGRGLSSMDEVLNSTVSGLNLLASGRPGEDAQIQIRGINSLTGSTDPMWIVDGMPLQGELPNIKVGANNLQSTIFTTGIGNIAPDDIKSITVLKDAAATAIYGARAANGVIVVETKKGIAGKTRFNVSVNYGIKERPSNNVAMMTTAQKIQFEREIFSDQQGYIYNPGRVTDLLRRAAYQEITTPQAETEIAKLAATNTDWFKEIFRTAITQQYSVSMSGGNEQTQHYASVNYLTDLGTVPNNNYDKLGMNIKLTHNPWDRVRIVGGMAATMKNDDVSASNINPLQYAMYANPYERLYNNDGSLAYDLTYDSKQSTLRDGLAWDKLNIMDDLNRNTNSNRYLDAELSLKLEWELLKGLMFTTHGVYNANSNHNRISEGENTYTNFVNNWYSYFGEIPHDMVRGSLREGTSYSNGFTFRNTLQYNNEFREKHFITLFAGQEIYKRTTFSSFNYSPVYDEGHRIIGFPEMEKVNGSEISYSDLGGTGKSIDKISSFFANASYSYMDKYVFTAALRYDGSDIVGNNNQFTPLWNVGGRWNLHRENFLKNSEIFNLASVRVGYGYTGSIDKNALPFVVMTLGQSIIYDGQSTPTSFDYSNPNIKWQTKRDFNVGMDLSMFDYRLELGLNYYNNITMDVLDRHSLPLSSGRTQVVENVADIYNEGFEIDLGVTVLKNKNLNWFLKGNVAINRNEVKNTYYKSTTDLQKLSPTSSNQFVEGYPVGAWFGYRFAGINKMTGAPLVYTGNDNATRDMSELGATVPNAATFYLGKKTPPVIGGVSTVLNWKQLMVSANLEFKTGHKIKSFNTFRTLDSKNRHSNDAYRWRQVGDDTNMPALSEAFRSYSMYMYNNLLESGNYLRMSYITVGYNFDTKLLSKIGFSTARISFTAKDLFTISKYKGIDPALMGSFGYPNSRKYTITLNVGF